MNRDFTSAKAKEALLPDKEDELRLLTQYKPPKELLDSLYDSTSKMCSEIVRMERDAAVRLYLLRAVAEDITPREAFAKYEVQTAATREFADGCPALTNDRDYAKMAYEDYVRLVPRGQGDGIDWQDAEIAFIDFITEGMEL